MADSYVEPCKYWGKLPRPLWEQTINEDLIYMKERVKDAEASRYTDSSGKFNALNTYRMILMRAQELPRKRGFHYSLNISSPQRPRLVLVKDGDNVPVKHITLEDVIKRIGLNKEQSWPRKKRKGWSGNEFFYKSKIKDPNFTFL